MITSVNIIKASLQQEHETLDSTRERSLMKAMRATTARQPCDYIDSHCLDDLGGKERSRHQVLSKSRRPERKEETLVEENTNELSGRP